MFERNIYDHYQLYCEDRFIVGNYEAFRSNGNTYVFIPHLETSGYPVDEQMKMAQHLTQNGENLVGQFIYTVQKKVSAQIDGDEGYLIYLPTVADQKKDFSTMELGARLAYFHDCGINFQVNRKSQQYYGQWKQLWEQRLQQLENWYNQVFKQPRNEIDEAFVLTFPYYMGLCENAMQYVVDSDIDEQYRSRDEAVICHQRFTDSSWLCPEEGAETYVKLPSEFIYDHPSRDVAEWIRFKIIEEKASFSEVVSFLDGYEQRRPLSKYSWRMVYARLLFPLHYFEVVEGYYRYHLSTSQEYYAKQFITVLDEEIKNEQFLRSFFTELQLPTYQGNLPMVDWLQERQPYLR
ncbi:spore coat putative kinase YutH [Bacillus alkalicellulosilyticus]|uniref:spore coat putative kinase YutH n=1 Tax=Alkalihalobacterium alkalicellulosilyticum TaxID=1912214 RepID=UPI0009971C94|nr:spore coat protein YutH [Bacillus alkalicellulosilyticus]